MTLSIELRGVKLTQEQLDAIVPVMNARLYARTSKAKFEEACLKAMADAGWPLDETKVGRCVEGDRCVCDARRLPNEVRVSCCNWRAA